MSLLTDFLKLFKWDTTSETDLDEEFDIDTSMNGNWDILDTKAKNHEDRINTLEEVQTEQDSLIQKLKDNMINLTTEEDTSLYITDAGTPPAKLTIRGNHYQETQEGTDNLAVLNEGTIEQNGLTVNIQNGEATMSGTNTASSTTSIKIGTAYLYAGQTYYQIKTGSQSSFGARIQNSSGVQHWFSNTESSFVCETTEEWDVYASAGANQAVNSTFKVMLSKTSGAEWVQGKKTIPSLEYPSEISTVKDEVNVVVSNKNLYKITASGKTDAGVTFTVKDDGTVVANGTSAGTYLNLGEMYLDAGTYTVSGGPANGDWNAQRLTLYLFKGPTETHSIYRNMTYTFTLTERTRVSLTYVAQVGSVLNNEVIKPMIEPGKITTDFIKHEEVKKTLDIQQEMLKGDDFDLENEKENHGYEKKNMSEIDWMVSSNQLQEKTYCFMVMYSVAGLSSTEINCFSNCFKSLTGSYLFANDEEGIAQSQSQILCRISKEKVADLNAFKALLAEKNAVVYVKNPTQLDLTATQKEVLAQLNNLDLFKGINNIYTEEGIALMQLDYSADTKMYIDNLIGSEVNNNG